MSPVNIHFNEALWVAFVGLVVNLVSAYLLTGRHHGHKRAERYGHDHDHNHDPNFRAAYLHVLADALTSVLAIIALITDRFFGDRI